MDVKKTNNYLQKLYEGIVMDVNKLAPIYKTYVWVLHIWNDIMKFYYDNRKDVGIA